MDKKMFKNTIKTAYNNGYKQWRGFQVFEHLVSQRGSVSWDTNASCNPPLFVPSTVNGKQNRHPIMTGIHYIPIEKIADFVDSILVVENNDVKKTFSLPLFAF
jgi:hypothetical protein